MKVLQINSVCGVGSTGKIAVDLAKELKENGHDSLICYGRGNGTGWDNTYKIGSDFSTNMHGLVSRLFDKHGLGSKNETKRLVEKIKEYNPDVVHLHNIHGYYVNYEILFKFLKDFNKPVVWTLHDCWSFTGHCTYFDAINCYKWETHCNKCPQKTRYPISLIADNSKDNFDRKKKIFTLVNKMIFVTPSNWLSRLVRKSFLSKYEVITINNGINLKVFKPTISTFRQKYNLENAKIILGVASIWSSRKGFDDFLVLSKMLSENERIVLVGLDDNQLKLLPSNIIGIKRTQDQNELAGLYSTANIFVNPTYEDNYPTTNLEAQACGTPAITYNTGGSIESVNSDCVVNKGDIAALKLCIDKCEKGNISTQNFSVELSSKKYMQLYNEIMLK